jgi:ribose-phosphate pyrophosphokinase
VSLLLAFDDEAPFADGLAAALGVERARVDRHTFPDGESRLRLPASLPPRVLLLRGLQQPNARLAELMLVAAGARELGARELVLVSPYLAYMRQDMAFTPGEVVSQRHLGRALAAWFDAVVTVDPHLHRIPRLEDVVVGRRCVTLTAAGLIGPDAESAQWVAAAAAAGGLPYAICEKRRHGDRDVDVDLPPVALRGRAVVLVDDVASTGRTLERAVRALLAAGAASVDVAVTHALFVDDALPVLRDAGVRHVWSTDCIGHPTNAISVQRLIADALR